MELNESPDDFIPRNDIYVGFSSMPEILSCYYNKDNYYIEKAMKDEVILDFRNELEQHIAEKTNGTACRFIGGATGIYCSYLDFIAWDLKKVLDAAREFFENKQLVEWADFQLYSLNSESVLIYEKSR